VRAAREIVVAATPDKLWALLWDVPRMVECMPGCAEAKEVAPQQRYTARMIQKVGPIRLSVPLDVEITSSDPPRRLALQAKGVARELVADALAEILMDESNVDGAVAAGALRLPSLHGTSLAIRRKLGAYLARRGYEAEVIDECRVRLADGRVTDAATLGSEIGS